MYVVRKFRVTKKTEEDLKRDFEISGLSCTFEKYKAIAKAFHCSGFNIDSAIIGYFDESRLQSLSEHIVSNMPELIYSGFEYVAIYRLPENVMYPEVDMTHANIYAYNTCLHRYEKIDSSYSDAAAMLYATHCDTDLDLTTYDSTECSTSEE